jgi:hypothetical protein
MQYNVCTKSVRGNEVSQSFFFFFFFFFLNHVLKSVGMYGTRMSRMDGQVSVIFLVGMCECHGWTDKFQLFQFSFSSVIQSSKSVRPHGPNQKKKEKDKFYGQTQTHRSDRVAIKWRPMAQFKNKHVLP